MLSDPSLALLSHCIVSDRTDVPKRTDLGVVPKYSSPQNKKNLYGEQGGFCLGCQMFGDNYPCRSCCLNSKCYPKCECDKSCFAMIFSVHIVSISPSIFYASLCLCQRKAEMSSFDCTGSIHQTATNTLGNVGPGLGRRERSDRSPSPGPVPVSYLEVTLTAPGLSGCRHGWSSAGLYANRDSCSVLSRSTRPRTVFSSSTATTSEPSASSAHLPDAQPKQLGRLALPPNAFSDTCPPRSPDPPPLCPTSFPVTSTTPPPSRIKGNITALD